MRKMRECVDVPKIKVLASVRVVGSKMRVQVQGRSIGNYVLQKKNQFPN